jgi:maltose O-acetyltransferase
LANWIVTKIKNQVAKLNRLLERRKIKHFSKNFKSCGVGFYVRFPVCIEGQQHISIGNNASINAFVHMWGHGGITIGDDCLIASHASINSVTHDSIAALYRESVVERPVTIGNNVWIGSHAVILPGITIGNNAIIGAGAVVTKNVPDNAVAAGVPAKVMRYVEGRDEL